MACQENRKHKQQYLKCPGGYFHGRSPKDSFQKAHWRTWAARWRRRHTVVLALGHVPIAPPRWTLSEASCWLEWSLLTSSYEPKTHSVSRLHKLGLEHNIGRSNLLMLMSKTIIILNKKNYNSKRNAKSGLQYWERYYYFPTIVYLSPTTGYALFANKRHCLATTLRYFRVFWTCVNLPS